MLIVDSKAAWNSVSSAQTGVAAMNLNGDAARNGAVFFPRIKHADPMLARDFEMALDRIAPTGWGWRHIEEGEENAPSHIRASLMGPQVLIPLTDDGELALGTWQGVFFCELDGPRTRSVYVTVLQ